MRLVPDVVTTMRDGVDLYADLYLPEDGTQLPTLLQRVPYDKTHPSIVDGALQVRQAVAAGYAVLVQDCRGRYSSGGVFTPFVNEAVDGADTIKWVTGQSWSNGRVGMFGRSYSAVLQWLTAGIRPEGLGAIAPMLSGSDVARDWFGLDDAFERGFVTFWALRYLAPDQLARAGDDEALDELMGVLKDPEEFYDRLDGADIDRFSVHVPYLREWLDPRTRQGGLKALRDLAVQPDVPGIPSFTIAGWYDIFLRSCLRTFGAARAGGNPERHQLLVGPWAHGTSPHGVFPQANFGPSASADAVALTQRQLRWFDRWLKPAPSREAVPAVVAFDTGERVWNEFPSWPPPASQEQVLRLTRDLRLQPSAERATVMMTHHADDPAPTVGGQTFLPGLEVAANAGPRCAAPLQQRDDVLCFTGSPAHEATVLAGPVVAELDVETAHAGIRVVARLCLRTSRGTVLLREAASRTRSSGSDRLVIDLGSVHRRIEPGEEVMLLVSHTSFPRFARGANDMLPGDSSDPTVHIRLGPSESMLSLTSLPGSA